jgi:DNA-binding transcriptional MerR regulator
VRISELSRVTGVAIPTVKYYLREGLLARGDATAPNQADYGSVHAHRLHLIRVLREVGGLTIGQVAAVLAAIDDDSVPRHELFGVAQRALERPRAAPVSEEVTLARDEIDRLLTELGWEVSAEAPARRSLADVLVALRTLGRDCGPEVFLPHARAAAQVAEQEVSGLEAESDRAAAVERLVVGTVVFEAALCALRRLAHEHHSAVRAALYTPEP